MSTLRKLIFRLRLKLRDTGLVVYSPYELIDALNESLAEVNKVVTKYYSHLNFTVPPGGDLTETSDTGWPTSFDDLISEYVLISLSNADYGTREQAKMLWREKVMLEASNYNAEHFMIRGAFDYHGNEHRHECSHEHKFRNEDNLIEIYQGATWNQLLTFRDQSGKIIENWDGATAKSQIRETPGGSSLADITCSVLPTGQVNQSLTSAQTKAIPVGDTFEPRLLYWDIFVTLSDGTVLPPVRGKVLVYPEATQ